MTATLTRMAGRLSAYRGAPKSAWLSSETVNRAVQLTAGWRITHLALLHQLECLSRATASNQTLNCQHLANTWMVWFIGIHNPFQEE